MMKIYLYIGLLGLVVATAACATNVSQLSVVEITPDSAPEAAVEISEVPKEAAAPPPPVNDRPSTGTLRIIVKWGTESAVDNYGYNVYRTEDVENGEWKRLNPRILSGIGTTSTPYLFRYLDTDLGTDREKIWNYKVEEIGLDGKKTYFSHPVTGENPFILRGKPKVISPEEEELFRESRYHKEILER